MSETAPPPAAAPAARQIPQALRPPRQARARPQEPIRSVPDYPRQNRIVSDETRAEPERVAVYIQTTAGVPMRMSRVAAAHAGKPVAHRWDAGWIPRQGDEIDAGDSLWRVAAVRWTYALSGPPRVTVVVDPVTLAGK